MDWVGEEVAHQEVNCRMLGGSCRERGTQGKDHEVCRSMDFLQRWGLKSDGYYGVKKA